MLRFSEPDLAQACIKLPEVLPALGPSCPRRMGLKVYEYGVLGYGLRVRRFRPRPGMFAARLSASKLQRVAWRLGRMDLWLKSKKRAKQQHGFTSEQTG